MTILKLLTITKFLGSFFDPALSWKFHMNHLARKLSDIIGNFSKVKNLMSYIWLMVLFTSFFLAQLNYCCMIWGAAAEAALINLEILQKRVLKIFLKVPKQTESRLVFSQTKDLTIAEIFQTQLLIFIYKYNRGLLLHVFNNMFSS